tara:strand:+ start:2026 stop:2349 length:324 start_codon:yes stop_codon:yes gene_type:complete
LAQNPAPDYTEDKTAVIAIEDPYTGSMNFGTLTVDVAKDGPLVSLKVTNVFGENVFPKFDLRASELPNGKTSLKSKVSTERWLTSKPVQDPPFEPEYSIFLTAEYVY